MKNILFFILGMSLLSIQVFAKNCKDVKLKVINNFKINQDDTKSPTIKVSSIYYNEGKGWRYENVKDKEIKGGKSHTFTENLEYVGGERINAFYVKFKFKNGKEWSKTYRSEPITRGWHHNDKCSKGDSFNLKFSRGKKD